jgi:hypothetical protein
LGLSAWPERKTLSSVSLDGVDRSEHLAAFAWLTDKVLARSVKTFVVLDRDYRDADAVAEIEAELKAADISPHVWKRHELENYLLVPDALSRISGAATEWVEHQLAEVVEGFEEDLYSGVSATMDRRLRKRRVDPKEIAKLARRAADAIWSDPQTRLNACPGKDVISRLNERLQAAGHRTLRPRQLADRLRAAEVAPEMRDFLLQVDRRRVMKRPAHAAVSARYLLCSSPGTGVGTPWACLLAGNATPWRSSSSWRDLLAG